MEELYELHHDLAEPPPDPILEYYPRALQLATTDGTNELTWKNIFVANDTEIGTETGCSTVTHYCNAPGSSWVIKLPYDGAQNPWQLWTGPFDNLTGNGGLATERFYTPVVLRHDLDQKNRVIALGGEYVVSATGENDIRRDVVELTPHASNPDIYKSTWDKKHDLISPRYFCNAVLLPTGRVLILGGAWDLCIDCDNPDRLPIPACCPELYEPGDTVAGIAPTSWLLAARPNDPASGTFSYPRLYHNVALGLADGRVLNAGGTNGLRCDSSDTDYPESEFTGDLFAPPYFHDPTRPLVALDSSSQVDFEGGTNDTIDVTVTYPDGHDPAREIDRFVLLRPGAVTHHFDNDQRYIELAFTASAPNGNQQAYTIDAPADDLGPPGFYMLFATRPTGANPPLDRVPSKAAVFLRLK